MRIHYLFSSPSSRQHLLISFLCFWTTTACAADWRKVREVDAPEAKQAAAADERYFYAVDNRVIAQYDRTTGERKAVSSGEAFHLNSGFLWNGKLYCAHSNYPLTPQQSDVRVLDPATMRLTVFKDFGDFGGSLTWAVHRDDVPDQSGWWCNFAHYGPENAKTILIRFDDAWREQARYVYPSEVLKQLGNYSLSGGIWRGDRLLCTGHDDPVLFVLKLPREGNVLEFVEQVAIPFTGQGIAADPQTGGLVGIDRKRRKVVFAEQK